MNASTSINRTSIALAVLVLTVGTAQVASQAPAPASIGGLDDPTSYPVRGFFGVKGLQPDFWPDRSEVAPGLGSVSMNLFWAEWEPAPSAPPCAPAQLDYDGRCFNLPVSVDSQLRAYTDLGVSVTAIVYGTPAWARGARPCIPIQSGFEVFCVPDDPANFARFADLIASRYNGTGGRGRITDFVIQNEVNANQWFNVGCGAGTPCDLERWVTDYAALYNAAYDRIRTAQPQARVLFSFEHHFGNALDDPDSDHPIRAIETFLPALVPKVGDREWSVAFHPYPVGVTPASNARDYPWGTLGNVGVMVGWLRARYPNEPHAWEVQLTEVGLNNPGPFDDLQRDELCQGFRNVLGTPGITSFIYHRMQDNAAEGGLALGLRRIDGSPKPAWYTWRLATDPDNPSCGFERYPNTVVQHGIDPMTGAQWYSSRDLPDDYVAQAEQWLLSYDPLPGAALLYECGIGDASSYLWRNADCRGNRPLGPVGYIATGPSAGKTALYACVGASSITATTATACNPGDQQVALGYVNGSPVPSPPSSTTTPSPAMPLATPVVAVPTFTG